MTSPPAPLPRADAVAEWRGWLAAACTAGLGFLAATGLAIFALPFGELPQLAVLLHTALGIAMLPPLGLYVARHWAARRRGRLSHLQLLGYLALAVLVACVVSGALLTWQGAAGPRRGQGAYLTHLGTGLAVVFFVLAHLGTAAGRKAGGEEARALGAAIRTFTGRSVAGAVALSGTVALGVALYVPPPLDRSFPADYSWRFGEDRPFAPSLARTDNGAWESALRADVLSLVPASARASFTAALDANPGEPVGAATRIRRAVAGGALGPAAGEAIEARLTLAARALRETGRLDPRSLAGSAGCGSAGCHEQIYREWLPSAHRYSSLDLLFQAVQEIMAAETSPEHTRYCAGCHDPISLLSGAKDAANVTLSALGSDEGTSCLACHSIVQTDVQGNADYTIREPRRYLFEYESLEADGGGSAKWVSDFLVRTYPDHHRRTYARPLYKTPEFCAACHKQYVDVEVNTDIGKVQGQNQYDSWRKSRWFHGEDSDRTLACRDCHMFLVPSRDPAAGDAVDANRAPDDGRHRHHGFPAANQYVPVQQGLEGAAEHVEIVNRWLRGELEVPEIADRWTEGPGVRMEILAPGAVEPGETVAAQVLLTNNKTGHDFPTGPLDMIESWVELVARDGEGRVLYQSGRIGPGGDLEDAPLVFKADGFDREGELIDRHNLWDLVGASYKRSLYPGFTDTIPMRFQCPSMGRPRPVTGAERTDTFAFEAPTADDELRLEASLWYRKANADFLRRVFGDRAAALRTPPTLMSRAEASVRVLRHAPGPR